MLSRQDELLKSIVEEYIKTAQPVGSKLIVDKYLTDFSSATVRNDMAELEEMGLICQPHTSAGRIPTAEGYKKFVENYVDLNQTLNTKEQEKIIALLSFKEGEEKIKLLAKILAEKSGLAIFVGFSASNVYYTGLSNIFLQNEFKDLNLIYHISTVVDHLDEVLQKIYNNKDATVEIKIGHENPFARDCSTVFTKIKNVLLGVVGPMRMNYQKNVELINFTRNII